MSKKFTSRTLAAQISYAVVFKKANLTETFKQKLTAISQTEIKASVKALCYETIRNYLYLQDIWLTCVEKRPKDKMVNVIMTQALAELKFLHKPEHAVVNEAINTAKKLNKNWATGLINSCLRKAVKKEIKPSCEAALYAHPQWWIDQLKHDWPDNWQQILTANNQKPPLWVRSRQPLAEHQYVEQHAEIKSAYKINAQDIVANAEFDKGLLSVQDASAQLAAIIIDPQNNERVLDACAAPGGKTCHLLEINNSIHLDALEIYPNRAKKIQQNLKRLNLKAQVIIADALQLQDWYAGKKYQKILLDVPCSASGILRRHPDIKFIRQPQQLKQICQDQQQLLEIIASTLDKNGRMLYATCSVFKQENSDQIKLFLKTHPEFSEIELKYPFAVSCEYGIQILSGTRDMDGFYYCYLQKNAN
jgi:16S rRNA (cytosine967-C5)-methyltransferase